MKRKIGTPVAVIAIVAVVALIGWLGWYYTENPYNRGLNEEAIFRAAEAKAKKNGIDLRTAPGAWPGLYYKYHPEEKPPAGVAEAASPPKTALPGNGGMPAAPPGP